MVPVEQDGRARRRNAGFTNRRTPVSATRACVRYRDVGRRQVVRECTSRARRAPNDPENSRRFAAQRSPQGEEAGSHGKRRAFRNGGTWWRNDRRGSALGHTRPRRTCAEQGFWQRRDHVTAGTDTAMNTRSNRELQYGRPEVQTPIEAHHSGETTRTGIPCNAGVPKAGALVRDHPGSLARETFRAVQAPQRPAADLSLAARTARTGGSVRRPARCIGSTFVSAMGRSAGAVHDRDAGRGQENARCRGLTIRAATGFGALGHRHQRFEGAASGTIIIVHGHACLR